MPTTQPDRSRLYEFEGFRLDAWRRMLYTPDGLRLRVKPKVCETLVYFVRHRGELLPKRQLLRALWGELVVDENGLNQQISALRRVLGEKPGDNRFIVTVAGQGYRFVAPVVPAEVADGAVHALARLRCSAMAAQVREPLRLVPRSEREIVCSRVYAAPRARLFEAWSSEALQRRWRVPPGWSMCDCESHVHSGGAWRHTLRGPGGAEQCRRGVFREVAPPERLVYTETRTGSDLDEMVVSASFTDGGDQTLQTIVLRTRSRRARESLLRSSTCAEMNVCFDQLAVLLQQEHDELRRH